MLARRKIDPHPLKSHKDECPARELKRGRNAPGIFADLGHRPLGGLLQLLIRTVGARPAGDYGLLYST